MSDIITKLREKANNLPMLPGVYIMKNERSEVIYVGKAKKLKNRVTSYFRGEHLPKVEAMVQKVADFDVIIAGSEFEALVLENSLIKRHMPHYNILLRDDKGYPFIRLDVKSEYPRFSVVNKTADDGAKYFGPFGSRGTTFEIIDTLCKTLLLPSCGKKFPRDIGKERPCLNHHMGTCRGYCLKDASAEEYREAIRSAEMILSGKVTELVSQLTEEMLRLSDEMRFELAAQYRDRIRAIENLANKQKVIATAYADTDAIGFFRGARTCFAVLHYKDGSLAGKNYEIMDDPLEDDATALSNFLSQYYGTRGAWAKTILLPFDIEDREEMQMFITEASGHKVNIEVPQRGDRVRITESACVNAREEVQRSTSAAQRRSKTLEWLQKTLDLSTLPNRIEAFDISNTGNFGIVAAMVVFIGGKPLKRDYRRFKIKDTPTQDDYASMHEAVKRRFIRCINGDEGFEEVPDLLLIDGGENHAAVAENALREIGLKLPVFGMVKDDRHRTRALITSDGHEIGIMGNQAAFSFIGGIQEEVHRYAIEYHRSLRAGTISSTLDSIPGIGEKRRNDLIKHFKTLKAIKNADIAELGRVLPEKAAQSVYEFFHYGEDKSECELSPELPEAEE
ncbi:MAG: excinuclease ABC subunit UvrC [Oscillospiraceae bacterium]|nr:excinuclease ABC subunit UvrC [Oscillospiraceae bacterium]